MTKLSDSDSVLSDWKKQIDSFKKLKIEEAQELYRKYISASDQESKDTYINELVLGTLYILYDYLLC